MTLNQCDKCGALLKSSRRFRVGFLFGAHVELCSDCIDPFVTLVKDEGLLTDELSVAIAKEKSESDF